MTQARFQTMRHIETVRNYLNVCLIELIHRQEQHDQSKLLPPEVDAYEAITHQLRGLTYGSDEYRAVLRAQKPAIHHHYQCNAHHPEHHPQGYKDMTLLDVLEMLCDWKAATLRHADGDIYTSLNINRDRFGYGEDFDRLLRNTVAWLETHTVFHHAEES